MTNTNQIKWQPQHFNQGAIVEVDQYWNQQDGNRLHNYTVSEIHQNGIDSFVLVMVEWNEALKMHKCFNTEHVTRIVSQGDKPAKIRYMDRDRYGREEYLQNALFSEGIKLRKGFMYSSSEMIELCEFALSLLPGEKILDGDKLRGVIAKQSWYSAKDAAKDPGDHLPYYVINKKRAKKFIKANINRFLLKKKVALQLEQDMLDNMWGYDESLLQYQEDEYIRISEELFAIKLREILNTRSLTVIEQLIEQEIRKDDNSVVSIYNDQQIEILEKIYSLNDLDLIYLECHKYFGNTDEIKKLEDWLERKKNRQQPDMTEVFSDLSPE